MKEQIEEMAKDLQETHDYEGCEAWHCSGCQYEEYGENYFCSSIKQAEKMTAKGYSKRKVGEWIFKFDLDNYIFYECSVCGRQESLLAKESTAEYFPYCHCGARMKGEEDEQAN